MTSQSDFAEFRFEFPGTELSVRNALDTLKSNLSPLGLDAEEIGTVELVLAEAMNNIVEHAYPPGDPVGNIQLQCSKSHDGLHFELLDTGRPMPEGRTPLGEQANVNVGLDDLPEGGFGWFLIHNLSKDVVYRRAAETNQLTFRIAVGL